MLFGADYYPEHWPETRWETDCRLMSEAGITAVRILEFAWARLEPDDGVYAFDWVERFIELAHRYGIQIILGTPSATPPKWLIDQDPSILPVDVAGRTKAFGSRRHYSYSNENYLQRSAKIAGEMAKRFGRHDAVIAWQTDNEFGCHDTTLSFDDATAAAFRVWLEKRYETVDAVNAAWGTVFWSQEYRSFAEIVLPAYTVAQDPGSSALESFDAQGHNPGLLLDFTRFSTDAVIRFHMAQVEAIREHSDRPVTHNLMGDFTDIDYHRFSETIDFVSWDNYPSFAWGRTFPHVLGFRHALMRGLKQKAFWVMEQQSGPCGWRTLGDTPASGEIKLWTMQAIAHGADAIVYFRWRACRTGTEQYWYGILDHDGTPRRRYQEISATVETVRSVESVFTETEPHASVALVIDYEVLWSHRFQPHNTGFDYNELLHNHYRALVSRGFNVAVTSLDTALEHAKVILLPAYSMVDDDQARKLEAFVEGGGVLVTGFRSGIRDRNNTMIEQQIPGGLSGIAGVRVSEFDSLNWGRTVSVQGQFGTSTAAVWTDILEVDGADAIGTYASGPFAGSAAITAHGHGSGVCYYVGCDLEIDGLGSLLVTAAERAGIEASPFRPLKHVEIVERRGNGRRVYCVLNHNAEAKTVELRRPLQVVSTGETISGLSISGFGFELLEEQ